jgi:hypothetical protein
VPLAPPLGFTDEQLAKLFDAPRSVPVDRRGDYLQDVAERLRGTCGDLRRAAIRAAQIARGG